MNASRGGVGSGRGPRQCSLNSMHNVLALGLVSLSSFSTDFSLFFKTQPQPRHFQEAFPEIPQVGQGDSLWAPCGTWSFSGWQLSQQAPCLSRCPRYPQHSAQGLTQVGAESEGHGPTSSCSQRTPAPLTGLVNHPGHLCCCTNSTAQPRRWCPRGVSTLLSSQYSQLAPQQV